MSEVHIVIFLADLNERARETVKQKLWAKYQKYIDDNIINAIQAPKEFYPKLKGLVRTYGDSQERMFWRSKQTMDYVFLFNYCESLSDYYLQMEDDVKTAKDFLTTIKTCMNRFEDEKWAFIQTSIWGFIGKLFKNDELNYFSRMLRIFYNDIPCDWLLHRYPTWRGDNATVADRICGNIFTHIGDQSSSLGT
jgi:alpha-1,3-mannosylglycoprotein beta-1,4-N-acetylglucosaminyltransferase C